MANLHDKLEPSAKSAQRKLLLASIIPICMDSYWNKNYENSLNNNKCDNTLKGEFIQAESYFLKKELFIYFGFYDLF